MTFVGHNILYVIFIMPVFDCDHSHHVSLIIQRDQTFSIFFCYQKLQKTDSTTEEEPSVPSEPSEGQPVSITAQHW